MIGQPAINKKEHFFVNGFNAAKPAGACLQKKHAAKVISKVEC
jgi:hypothetical protein